jgi:hypothetical protein
LLPGYSYAQAMYAPAQPSAQQPAGARLRTVLLADEVRRVIEVIPATRI